MIWNCYHFYKHNTKFTRNQDIFKNSIFIQKWFKKKHVMYWDNYKHYYKKLQKIVPKFIRIKKFFLGKRTCNPFLK